LHEVNEIPNLIYVLQNYFRYIFVGPNRHAFLRSVFDRLFCDSDVSILCTDQSVTSIHACSDFLRNIRQFVAKEPEILLAITRYDPRISPDADRIAHTIGIGQDYQIIPWDRQHVDSHRNAGLPLIHPNARSPFADSTRQFMARIDEDFAAAHRKSRKGRQKWRRLLRLNR